MKVLLSISLVLMGVTVAHSQTSEPASRERAMQLRFESQKILRESPHRVQLTVEMRPTEESQWELYSSQTMEVVGSTRHTVQHTGLKLEFIHVGRVTYKKEPGGPWQFLGDTYTGATVRTLEKKEENSLAQKADGSKVLETKSQEVTERLHQGEVVNQDRKVREWFDDEGRLTRRELEHFNFGRKKFQRVTEIYEYDPNIKIEVPATYEYGPNIKTGAPIKEPAM